jgi:hypothetical protein
VKIKLGKLPNNVNVRVSVSMTATLKAQLERYAELHSQTWEQKVDAATLIPYIVEQFLANDRAFRKRERGIALKSDDPN